MSDMPPAETRRIDAWRPTFDAIIGGVMLLLAFGGVALSDVSQGSQIYWSGLAIVFGLLCVALDWIHEPRGTAWAGPTLRTALHWLGVLAALELVFIFISAGRLTNADTGLFNGVVLALGTYTCGVYANWRLMIIGVALGLGTAAVAYVEQYLWILFLLALLALAGIFFFTRWRSRRAA
ncbi:hypothetical protein [Amaricoccus sp.]|uniref:hypothetical protein n=1 Tax=Amaricoccus sp. TaxID=1872485 RepID=UPI002607CED6|nr:hypothetical protein [uncultured Amaricoccus sp.]